MTPELEKLIQEIEVWEIQELQKERRKKKQKLPFLFPMKEFQ
jgi:hypothetical protein